MRAPGAVHVLRSAQATRQARRAAPFPSHVRLHCFSSSLHVLRHAVALARDACSDTAASATVAHDAMDRRHRCTRGQYRRPVGDVNTRWTAITYGSMRRCPAQRCRKGLSRPRGQDRLGARIGEGGRRHDESMRVVGVSMWIPPFPRQA
jgi:hypothetical protein